MVAREFGLLDGQVIADEGLAETFRKAAIVAQCRQRLIERPRKQRRYGLIGCIRRRTRIELARKPVAIGLLTGGRSSPSSPKAHETIVRKPEDGRCSVPPISQILNTQLVARAPSHTTSTLVGHSVNRKNKLVGHLVRVCDFKTHATR